MSDTPTTNARWERLCCSGQSWYQIAEEMKLDCRQLERELTAARAEIAELNEEYGTWWAQKRIALDELKEVTEQRDRLAEALTKIARGEPNWADCVVLAREALQSLNQPETTI